MLATQIYDLGKLPFTRMILPLKTFASYPGDVLGFDTEYVSASGEYLSTQLAGESGAEIFCEERKLTVDGLASYCRKLGVTSPQVLLVSYASWSELQFLPVRTKSFNWQEYGSSFDCSFYSERHKLALHVFDLARFFERQPLAKVAEAFGEQKLEYDTSRVTRKSLRDPKFRRYAVHDAEITYRIFAALRAEFLEYGVDIAITRTPARTASTIFRSPQFLDRPLENHNNRARFVGMRSAWGGRAEAFARGHFRKLYEYDLPSAYPNAAIYLEKMPVTRDWHEIKTLRGLDKYIGGFADVYFSFPRDELYPCLPQIVDGVQLYPLEGREFVTFEELKLALELGAKIRLVEGFGFKGGSTHLADFMRHMLAVREQATGARKIAAKLSANSLIGKLNQRTEDIPTEEILKASERLATSIETLMGLSKLDLAALGLKPTVSVGACYMPEYNALITGVTRARLSYMVRKYNAVYCATDSIWTEEQVSNPPFGAALKRKGPGDVFRTRLGRIGDHVVHHSIGTKQAAAQLFDSYISEGESVATYEKRRPLKLREALRSGRTVGKWITESRTASLAWDHKRKLNSDGSTSPWTNSEQRKNVLALARKRQSRSRDSS